MDNASKNELVEFSLLVDAIYQGAADVNAWASIPEKIAAWIGAKTCLICTPQFAADVGGFAVHHKLDVFQLLESKYREHNIWEARAIERGLIHTGAVIPDEALVTVEEVENSIIYNEVLKSVDLGRMIAGIVFSPQDNDGKLILAAVHQALSNPFSQQQVDKFKLLVPHLSRALGVMFKLRDAEFRVATSLEALNKLPSGIVLFNSQGEVTFTNKEATALLNRRQGLSLATGKNGSTKYLVATQDNTQSALMDAIDECVRPNFLNTRHFSQSVLVDRGDDLAPLTLNFSNLGEQHEFKDHTHSVAIAFINEPEQKILLNEEVIKRSYSLTKTETKIVNLLVEGDVVKQVAKKLAVAENTIKYHIKNIYIKTNTHNRAQLIRLMMSLSK